MNLVIINLILFLNYSPTQAQGSINKVNIESLQFKGNSDKYFQVTHDPSTMQSVLGNYTSVEDFYFEIDEVMATLYSYNRNKFYFVSNQLHSWEIVDSTTSIGRNDKYFKVGDPVEMVYEIFPEIEKVSEKNYVLSVPLRSINYDMECTNMHIFLSLNGRVTSIQVHSC
jgi:hypothetical protein